MYSTKPPLPTIQQAGTEQHQHSMDTPPAVHGVVYVCDHSQVTPAQYSYQQLHNIW